MLREVPHPTPDNRSIVCFFIDLESLQLRCRFGADAVAIRFNPDPQRVRPTRKRRHAVDASKANARAGVLRTPAACDRDCDEHERTDASQCHLCSAAPVAGR